jgi:hypothetical protein
MRRYTLGEVAATLGAFVVAPTPYVRLDSEKLVHAR